MSSTSESGQAFPNAWFQPQSRTSSKSEGKSKGKGKKDNPWARKGLDDAPSKTEDNGKLVFERGETVEVFFRFSCDKGQGYFPVENYAQGMLHPITVKTDGKFQERKNPYHSFYINVHLKTLLGWFQAIVEQRWEATEEDMRALTEGRLYNSDPNDPGCGNGHGISPTLVPVTGKDKILQQDGSCSTFGKKGEQKKGENKAQGDENKPKDGKRKERCANPVKIKYLSSLWFNRNAEMWNESNKRRDSVSFKYVRKLPPAGTEHPPPKLSLYCVRWGGKKKVGAVQEGLGGWGAVGSNPSDPFMNTLLTQYPMEVLDGPNYEIITTFIQSTHELRDDREGINATSVLAHMHPKSEYRAGLYFLWPIAFLDGHQFPGYVNRQDMISLMARMEGQGIVSRFPHHSHLYTVLASKEWTSSWCMVPGLNVPLTTKVPRSLCMEKGFRFAAVSAITALNDLNYARNHVFGHNGYGFNGTGEKCSNPGPKEAALQPEQLGEKVRLDHPQKFAFDKPHITKGVAKLGFSWEALDVRHWDSPDCLAEQLESLIVQPGNKADTVHVQEFVDIDVEMRHFVVLPKYCGRKVDNLEGREESTLPNIEKVVYTCYESSDENHFSDFNRFDRETCVKNRFKGDDSALADAEAKAKELIGRLLIALRGESCEMPPVLRFDILAKRTGPGKAKVAIGEITELGACFLGWSDGPRTCFKALIRSCLGADDMGTWGRNLKQILTNTEPKGAVQRTLENSKWLPDGTANTNYKPEAGVDDLSTPLLNEFNPRHHNYHPLTDPREGANPQHGGVISVTRLNGAVGYSNANEGMDKERKMRARKDSRERANSNDSRVRQRDESDNDSYCDNYTSGTDRRGSVGQDQFETDCQRWLEEEHWKTMRENGFVDCKVQDPPTGTDQSTIASPDGEKEQQQS